MVETEHSESETKVQQSQDKMETDQNTCKRPRADSEDKEGPVKKARLDELSDEAVEIFKQTNGDAKETNGDVASRGNSRETDSENNMTPFENLSNTDAAHVAANDENDETEKENSKENTDDAENVEKVKEQKEEEENKEKEEKEEKENVKEIAKDTENAKGSIEKDNTEKDVVKKDVKEDATIDDAVKDKEEKSTESLKESSQSTDKSANKDIETSDEKEEDKGDEKESNKDKSETSKKGKSVINGMELTVENASDEESKDEGSDKERSSKPKTKTTIVREKPNADEFDASSSEEEKSEETIVQVNPKSKSTESPKTPAKQVKKRGRPRKVVESNSEGDNDEEYLPKTKVKKSPITKKTSIKTTDGKKGRGRPRGRPSKTAKNVIHEEEEERVEEVKEKIKEKEIKENLKEKVEKKEKNKKKQKHFQSKHEYKNENLKKEESFDKSSDSHDDSNNDDDEDIKSGKRRKPSTRNKKRIETLKKYIRMAGLRVKCYDTLLKDCKTDNEKWRRLHEFLEEQGIYGKPDKWKCEQLRIKNELKKETEELDASNVISETHSNRGRPSKKWQVESATEPIVSPTKTRTTLKKIKAIVDSDNSE